MEEWIIETMQSMGEWGFIGILLLMAAENIFPPIPSELVLTCAGFLTTCSTLTRGQAIVSATLGSLLGAVILYGLGRILPVERLERLGFSQSETAAFGDGDNDVEMLSFAGTGIAMENATPACLGAADFVTKSNREDGVAWGMERFLGI